MRIHIAYAKMNSLAIIASILSLRCLSYINYVTALETENIVGGLVGKAEDFKFLCIVTILNRQSCGYAILNNKYVLTAAHCVVNKKNKFRDLSYGVVAGIDNLKNINKGIKTTVTKAYIHKDYEGKTFANDIAILEVKNSFNLDKNSNKLQSVKLPESEDVYMNNIGKEGFAPGFGWDSVIVLKRWLIAGQDTTYGWSSGILKYGRVELISKEECERNTLDDQIKITDKVVCGHSKPKTLQDGAGVCYGDSGGPLVLSNTNTILGIVSYSSGRCDDTTRAAVFTKVLSYIKFIEDIKNGKGSSDAKSYDVEGIVRYTVNQAISAFCSCLRAPSTNDAYAALTYAIDRCPCTV